MANIKTIWQRSNHKGLIFGAVATTLLVGIALLTNGGGAESQSGVGFSLLDMIGGMFALTIALAFLPVIIAVHRKHPQTGLIAVLSVLGIVPVIGWITWIIALAMAAAGPVGVPATSITPQLPYGTVADGRVLARTEDGPRWIPVQ